MARQYAESYFYKTKKYAMYTFTGIVVASTLYSMFISQPPTFDTPAKKNDDDATKKKKKKKPKPADKHNIDEWTRVELFQFLAKVSLLIKFDDLFILYTNRPKNKIYPDVDTPEAELKEQVLKIQRIADEKSTEEIVLEASL